MIQSMTGYGRAEVQLAPYHLSIEARSVNHRYLDLSIKLPRDLAALESPLRKVVQGRVMRGRVDVFVNLKELSAAENSGTKISLRRDLAKQYYQVLEELRRDLKLDEPVSLGVLTDLRELVCVEKVGPDVERLGARMCEALAAALDELTAMRAVEGRVLLDDIYLRLKLLSTQIEKVTKRLPQLVTDYRDKLRRRVAALVEGLEVDAERLEIEVVYLAERQDVTEELVRLRSHLEHFETLTHLDEPVGRKLDFLLQEMNRETNTISSKVADNEVAQHVIEMKSLIEQIREQVQNLQ